MTIAGLQIAALFGTLVALYVQSKSCMGGQVPHSDAWAIGFIVFALIACGFSFVFSILHDTRKDWQK